MRAAYGLALLGYVAIPEHIPEPISEPADGTASMVTQMLKPSGSRRLRRKAVFRSRSR